MKRVFAFIGFTVAITLIVLNIIPFSFVKYITIAAVALFIVSLLVKSLRKEKVIPVVLVSVIFACSVFSIHYISSYNPVVNLDGEKANISFEIIDLPTKKTDGGYSYTVKVKSVDIPSSPQTFKMKLNTNFPLKADACQTVHANVYFKQIADNGFDSFGYFGDGIYLSAALYSYDVTPIVRQNIGYHILEIRKTIIDILKDNLPSGVYPLAVSVMTGDKSYLDSGIISDFKICGISHIIAVSGLHISIICMSVYSLLKLFGVSKFKNTFITLIVLFVYSGIADYSKSVLRAGIMITVLLLAKLIDKKSDTLNSLGLSVFIICFNPYAVTDISALLTVTAVIGIVVVKKEIDKHFSPENNVIRYIYDVMSISFSVLLTTFPVMWLYFGSVSIVGVFLNIIIIPLLQAALISIVFLCLFFKIPFLAFIPKAVSYFTLNLIIVISDFCADTFSLFVFDISSSVFGVAAAGVLLLIAISIFVGKDISLKITAPFIVIVLVISSLFAGYEREYSTYLYITSSGAVFAYDKDVFVAIDVDDKNDKYAYDSLVENKNFDYIDLIDCDYLESNDVFGDLGENISVNRVNGILILTICDNIFEIDEDYVTINNNIYVRDLYGKYSIDTDTVIRFAQEV